jgi:hypothetical protein
VRGQPVGSEDRGRVVGVELVLPVGDVHVVGLGQAPVQELVGLRLPRRPRPLGVQALDERVVDLVGAQDLIEVVEPRDGVESNRPCRGIRCRRRSSDRLTYGSNGYADSRNSSSACVIKTRRTPGSECRREWLSAPQCSGAHPAPAAAVRGR